MMFVQEAVLHFWLMFGKFWKEWLYSDIYHLSALLAQFLINRLEYLYIII
jgi:hypothetical protein